MSVQQNPVRGSETERLFRFLPRDDAYVSDQGTDVNAYDQEDITGSFSFRDSPALWAFGSDAADPTLTIDISSAIEGFERPVVRFIKQSRTARYDVFDTDAGEMLTQKNQSMWDYVRPLPTTTEIQFRNWSFVDENAFTGERADTPYWSTYYQSDNEEAGVILAYGLAVDLRDGYDRYF